MPDKDENKGPNSLFVGTLAKGLQVLRAFDESHTALSLGELVARTGLDKSAVQRLAHTLHVEGMLDKDPTSRRFSPSHAWLELAYVYYWSDPLIARAMPKLVELSGSIGETVNLAQMSGDHIIYALRLPNQRTHFAASIIGRRLPAIATAAGRVMLATWPQAEWEAAVSTWPIQAFTPKTVTDRESIRLDVEQAVRNGFTITANQMMLNEISVALPIRGIDSRARAAVQVSVSSHKFDFARIRLEILPALQDAANGILA